ncbi:hypothetical protein [Magnetospirillum molischianum]|uniref:Lipoprotein n=1 Tax=Magnetospirillum molischianum DSM 120 TaxID=1150626 RepID=H8FVS0_MAGML|nr:hypothetical protein [Magnetospirillum molischianum]CCG42458.1 exported hypothetical protein [Magnetospirillum molischianum DSM 120]
MKTIRIPMILAAAFILGTMEACTTPLTVEVEPGQLSLADTAEPIAQDTTIFTVIEHIDDDRLTLRMLHSVMSAHADTILFVGDEIHVALEPLLPKNSRRGGCATAILGRQGQGMGRIVPGTNSGRHPACLARLQDFRGAEGLPVHDIHLNQVARVMLTGDLVFDGQGVTAQIRRCDEFQAWSADFLKKTWQPYKPVDGQTRNTCDFDGDPRPMEQRACRSGNTQGAHWGFTDPSGRWVQVSACVPEMTAQ